MIIKLKTFARFRDLLGEDLNINLERGGTISDLLIALIPFSIDLQGQIFDQPNEIREDVNIVVNGQHIESLEGLNTGLKDGDEVNIFPAVIGG